MDNETLNDVMLNINDKQSWVVLWGDPDRDPFSEAMHFDEPVLEHWFPMNPASMQTGDILFAHRIRFSMIMFVGEVISLPRRATQAELDANPGHDRWMWSVEVRNLTPILGVIWREINLKTFALAKEYNETHPESQITLGRLNFGAPAKISKEFARFLLERILSVHQG